MEESLLKRQVSTGSLDFEESFWTVRAEEPPPTVVLTPSLVPEGEALPEGRSSVLGSALTLVTTSIGTGLLALPFAFASVGLGNGLLALAVFAVLSGASSYLLCQCCEWSKVYSYEEVMVAAFGRSGAVAMEVVVVWLLMGAMTSLLVVTGDALSLAVESTAALAAVGGLGRTRLVLLDVCFVVLPLSWAQSPHSLRHSNLVAVSCTMLVVVLLVTRGLSTVGGVASVAQATPAGRSALLSLPVIMLSLGCQVQVPCVYGELQGRSLRRMSSALLAVGSVCFCLYTAVAVAGLSLAAHGGFAEVPGNVLDCLPAGDVVALTMRVVMGLAVLLVYPMLCLPCRSTIDHLVCGGGASISMPHQKMTWRWARHAAETLLIVGATTAIATHDTDLASIFGFTGATAGALISYLLPPACYLQLWRLRPGPERAASSGWAALALLALAIMTPLSLAITWRELWPA